MENLSAAPVTTVEDCEPARATVDRLLLTISDAAAALAVGRTTVYALIAAGELPVVHIGRSSRVPVEAVREFVAAKQARA